MDRISQQFRMDKLAKAGKLWVKDQNDPFG